jgi:hypothetical protein
VVDVGGVVADEGFDDVVFVEDAGDGDDAGHGVGLTWGGDFCRLLAGG